MIVVGQKCTHEGQLLDDLKIDKIKSWPPCESTTEVRGFLGTTGTIWNWTNNYAMITQPPNALMRKNTKCVWGADEQHAMDSLKADPLIMLRLGPNGSELLKMSLE